MNPSGRYRQKLTERQGDRRMTYINAFRCQGGLVMSADTQESWGDYKNYVEKISIIEDQSYPLAIGGAGIGDLIEPMIQEVIERAAESKPETTASLKKLLITAIQTVYRDDLPWLAVKKHERTPEFLVCAKPTNDNFCIFRIKGKRLFLIHNNAIVGYGTPVNYALLQRMYKTSISVAQGIILGTYLVAQSKMLDEGVGGETRIVTVATHGAFVEDKEYVELLEKRARELLKAFDGLFLLTADVAVREGDFDDRLAMFQKAVKEKRFEYLRETSISLFEKLNDPTWKGDAYAKMPEGTSMTAVNTNRCVLFREGKPWLIVPDGYTDDGRAKMRLIPLNSSEAEGKASFEEPIKLIGVPIDQLSTLEGRQRAQKILSNNADKLRDILRSDKSTAQGWMQLKVGSPLSIQNFGNEQSDKKTI